MTTDHELDDLITQAAGTPPPAAIETALLLARATMTDAAADPPARARHHRWAVLVAAAAAALLLSGAGTLAAYQLSVPPFQTLEDGVQRTRTSIHVDYVNSLGRRVECLAFMETRNLDADQQMTLETLAGDRRWVGYGQRVLDGLDIPDADPSQQNEQIFDTVSQDLRRAARESVPGMAESPIDDPSGPAYAGTAMSCANPGASMGVRDARRARNQGDQSRARAIVEANTPGLLAYFYRRVAVAEDAGDLLGETLLVAWRRAKDIPTDDHEARMYLFGVARRVLATHRRGRARHHALQHKLREELRTEHRTPRTPDDLDLLTAVAALDEIDQEIIRLTYWDGFTLAEAAALLDVPEGTVRSRHHRARQTLRRQLSSAAAEPSP